MSELSPAAQAAIDAAWKGVPSGMRDPYVVRCEQIAAALRVVADQVVAPEDLPSRGMRPGGTGLLGDSETRVHERQAIRRQILAIAAELDPQQRPDADPVTEIPVTANRSQGGTTHA